MQRANVLPAMCGTEKPQDHSQGPLKLHHSLTPRRRRSEGAWLHGGGRSRRGGGGGESWGGSRDRGEEEEEGDGKGREAAQGKIECAAVWLRCPDAYSIHLFSLRISHPSVGVGANQIARIRSPSPTGDPAADQKVWLPV